jgi:hypothetical protein
MKRTVLFLLALGAVTMMGAQEQPGRDRERPGPNKRNETAETVTLGGTLTLERGRIALKSGEDRYFVAGIRPLIGFVDGLREGAEVTLEGVVLKAGPNGEHKLLRARKLSLNGKDYELPQHHPGFRTARDGGRPDRDNRRGWGAGPGRCGHQEWGRSPGRFRERGPDWYRGGRHGPPVRSGR